MVNKYLDRETKFTGDSDASRGIAFVSPRQMRKKREIYTNEKVSDDAHTIFSHMYVQVFHNTPSSPVLLKNTKRTFVARAASS